MPKMPTDFERAFTMLSEFNPEAFQRKMERAAHAICTVSYRNAKGEDCRSVGFLCCLRLPVRGNVFGIMTSGTILNTTIFESFKFFVFDVSFSRRLTNLKQYRYTLGIHRDIESWFVSDAKHLNVSFVELRPELQLSFVENGCIFLTLFERQLALKGRGVLVMEDSEAIFSRAVVNDSLMFDSEIRLSRLGLIGSPILDDYTFQVVGVAKFGDKFCKEVASSIKAIVQAIIKEKLTRIPVYAAPRKSLLNEGIAAIDMSKSRLGHIRDSVVIPFHLRQAICERLQQYLIMTADDLVSCTDDQVKKVFPEDSLNHAISKWQKAVTEDPDIEKLPKVAKEPKKMQPIDVQAYAASRIVFCLKESASQSGLPECFHETCYFNSWGKKPKVKLLNAPAYIRAILVIPERERTSQGTRSRSHTPLILVITSIGHVIALPANDFSGGVLWQTRLTMPNEAADVVEQEINNDLTEETNEDTKKSSSSEEKTKLADMNIVHAVYDSLVDYLYVTMGDGNIYRVRLAGLKEAGKSEDDDVTVAMKLLIDTTQTEGRHFWGMSIDTGARLLFACDNGGALNDVSVWRLPTPIDGTKRRLLSSIELVASLKSCFIPAFCSIYTPPKQLSELILNCKERSTLSTISNMSSATPRGAPPKTPPHSADCRDGVTLLLAVSDWRTSRIELFAGVLVDDNEMLTPSVLRYLGPIAKRDGANPSRPGYVSKPCEIAFDSEGNLIVADQLNHRISVFAPPSSDCFVAKPLRNVWLSKATGSVVERFALIRSPRTGRAALLSHVNYKTLIAFE